MFLQTLIIFGINKCIKGYMWKVHRSHLTAKVEIFSFKIRKKYKDAYSQHSNTVLCKFQPKQLDKKKGGRLKRGKK